ncbi:Predicted RNA binding protein YcfA, dsRBD-like fold, HicA-like mRNA interferase family [Paenibacillus naphthalenovorans]|nr:Predicted RNA binding protein YcfA, dsRBD-like fold, HicA-like mRNA interferase family [Paenibacillus naphthalenovorans]
MKHNSLARIFMRIYLFTRIIMRVIIKSREEVTRLGKQVKVRDAIRALKKAGFIESPNHGNGTSHRRYIHKDDPKRFADISYHSGGEVIPKGTLKNIERSSGVTF